MYSPYLRGKQFEFLALRELSQELSLDNKNRLFPIIEPVKRSVRDAKNAFEALRSNQVKFAVILNPKNGDFQRGSRNYYELVKDSLPAGDDTWYPAYILYDKAELIEGSISHNSFEKIVAIVPKDVEIEDWKDFLSQGFVEYIVVLNAGSSSVQRKISRIGKRTIRLDDCFPLERRNDDYRGREDQYFNDQHHFYNRDWYGFGDYTTLPSSYIEGGLTPYVVAIHLTYKKDDEEYWVHHFLSESNPKGQENIQDKFYEAAKLVQPFFEHREERDSLSVHLIQKFIDEQHYPGLGVLKKLSMKHHISIMCRY